MHAAAQMESQHQTAHTVGKRNALAAKMAITNLEIAAMKIYVIAQKAQELEEHPVLEMELRNALAAIVAITNLETAA